MTQLETLIEAIPKYQPGADLAVLERAYRFSEASHQGQQRASGEPYLSHPLEVAHLLAEFKMDVTTVTAGLLHDVLEDTSATKADLEREFGKEIAELVDGVTKLGKLAFSSREESGGESLTGVQNYWVNRTFLRHDPTRDPDRGDSEVPAGG